MIPDHTAESGREWHSEALPDSHSRIQAIRISGYPGARRARGIGLCRILRKQNAARAKPGSPLPPGAERQAPSHARPRGITGAPPKPRYGVEGKERGFGAAFRRKDVTNRSDARRVRPLVSPTAKLAGWPRDGQGIPRGLACEEAPSRGQGGGSWRSPDLQG